MNSTMENSTGIFYCSGCRIGTSVDLEALQQKLSGELSPACSARHPALCSPAGIAVVNDHIEKHRLKGCLFAACGKGMKDHAFIKDEHILTHRVNLREPVSWAMDPGDEDTQMAAEDYVRMGMAALKTMRTAQPFILDAISSEILVLGGGISGLNAALQGAAAGYRIHLVEKSDRLGGWAGRFSKQIPFDEPFSTLRDTGMEALIEKVTSHSRITVHLGSGVERIDGQPGAFTVALNGKKKQELVVGSMVTATGWKPYDPGDKPFYGYGKLPGVMTSVDFEEKAGAGSLEPADSILFIQCAGSRDPEHLPYCSSVCCSITLKQAAMYRELYPDSVVYILYRDMRTPGFVEEFYQEVQQDPGIIFMKGTWEATEQSGDRLKVTVKDELLGETLMVSADCVVLATGMVPNGREDLHLGYRQGEGLPDLKYEFPDSHFICFPYESRRTGIYASGAMRAPMDMPSAAEDAGGAMLKAIQTIEATKRGEAVHPRAGDTTYPELYMERCTDCKRCTEECPFGTYDETPKGTPIVHPNRCRRCGICLGSCPERVISFADFSINLVSSMIKAVEVPDEFEEKPRVLVFLCENDALPALQMASRKGLKISPYVRIIPVRCLGSINNVWISDALSKGFDGILMIGCKPGDDYQCHFIHGSELNEQRSENMVETLNSMMLEPERVRTEFVEITDYTGIIRHIDEYMEEMELVGPNPFKDM
jgi:quinone-modifying oxidoreductase subunit QmoB